jgi:hypothetical protein
VLIVNKSIAEPGIIANAALVLGLTVGRHLPEETFGAAVVDGDGRSHESLTSIGHIVRKATAAKLRTLWDTFSVDPEVYVVDYTEAAAPADYDAYAAALGSRRSEEITFRAIHVYGPGEKIIPLTKNLSSL